MMFRIAPKRTIVAIGTACALCATATFAASPSHEEEQPIVLAQAGSSRTAVATPNDAQAVIRRIRLAYAAPRQRSGCTAPIDRTRMIYGFYYGDFASRD